MGVGPLHTIDEAAEGNEAMEKRERQEGITTGQAKGRTQRWQPLQPNLARVNEAVIDPPRVLSEEPTAVTPHGGICGGESQQWLSYPTKPPVRIWCSEASCHSSGRESCQQKGSDHCCSHIQRQEGRPTCWKPGSKSPLGPGRPGLIRHRRASNLTGRSVSESGSPEIRALRETDCRINGSAELFRSWRRLCSASETEP